MPANMMRRPKFITSSGVMGIPLRSVSFLTSHTPHQHGGDVHESVPAKRERSDFEYDGAQIANSLPEGDARCILRFRHERRGSRLGYPADYFEW